MKTGKDVKKGCCLSTTLFSLYNEYLTNEALEEFGDFKFRGQVIHTVKYTDNLVLLAKEEMVLQGTTGRLTETGRCYRMAMCVCVCVCVCVLGGGVR
jgi:hypothetical protein